MATNRAEHLRKENRANKALGASSDYSFSPALDENSLQLVTSQLQSGVNRKDWLFNKGKEYEERRQDKF
jgi:hypothetical protein